MTAVFDATGTIRAVAGQAGLINERGHIISGGRPGLRGLRQQHGGGRGGGARQPSTSNLPQAPLPAARQV